MTPTPLPMVEVLQKLRAQFAAHFHIEVESDDADLLADGLLDSLRLVELLLLVEEQFGVQLALDSIELDDLRTLRRLAALIAARRDETLHGSATQRAATARRG